LIYFLNNSHRNIISRSWYVGSVVLFFEHKLGDESRFLVLVDLAEQNSVSDIDTARPMVKLFCTEANRRLAVVRFEDIICNVGLVKTTTDRCYSVISHHIFKESLSGSSSGGISPGSLSNII
jgi:hypothetical protein